MTVTIYAGNAGDRNERAMRGAIELGTMVAERLGEASRTIGTAMPLVSGGWAEQLRAATPDLRLLADDFADRLERELRPVTVMGRCAASIATLPAVGRKHPRAAIVWFDAHGDCNVPIDGCTDDMNYLGGMVITGAAGEWNTGLGAGIDLADVILVGARDLDPPERARIAAGQIGLVPVGPDLGRRLEEAVTGRTVYVHLDCDVLDAGLVATEYQSPGGLTYPALADAFATLARCDVIGLEITEYEDRWPDGSPNGADRLLDAIAPLLSALKGDGLPLDRSGT